MNRGLVIRTTGKKHQVRAGKEIYDCTLKGKFRIQGIRSTNPVAVGDIVEFEKEDDNTGLITAICERKNQILRKSSNLSKETHIIAANIDQAVIVYTFKDPHTTTVFLDRLLVAAESYSLPAYIVFNKIDLYSEEETKIIKELRNLYEKIGYKTVACSVKENINLGAVRNILKDNINVILGHSGAGKSSLINTIQPGLNLKTGEISDYHKTGKHITTYARMLELSFGGYIIDTPGIRGFGLVNIKTEEIYHFFPEIFALSTKCRYYNCTHLHEPDCEVMNALEKGEIAWSRYKSYLNMVLDENDKHRQKDLGIL
jgi:ribosome biogenesis GTPase / thiamine phosphate phosphatase